MSMTVEKAGVTSWYRRPVALCAVGAANLLVKLSPLNQRRVLEFLARGARPSAMDEAARARDAVTAVSTRCRGNWCLQRSIATVLVSRLSGHWPDWRSGVRTYPFAAHAWVEVDGVPVNEETAVADTFQVTMAVSAGKQNRGG